MSLPNESTTNLYFPNGTGSEGSTTDRTSLAIVFISFLLIVSGLLALSTMLRTSKMPEGIRILSSGVMLSDIFGGTVYFVSQILLYCSANINSLELRNVRIIIIHCSIVITAMFISALSIERVLVLYFTELSLKIATRRFFIALAITLWMLGAVSVYLFHFFFDTHEWTNCKVCTDSGMTKEGRIVYYVWYFGLSLSIIVPTFFIFLMVRRHMRRIEAFLPMDSRDAANRKQRVGNQSASISISVIAFSFMVMNLPFFIVSLIVEADVNHSINKETRAKLFNVALVFIQCHCLLNTIIYSWRFKECRLKLLETFLPLIKSLRPTVELLRTELYSS